MFLCIQGYRLWATYDVFGMMMNTIKNTFKRKYRYIQTFDSNVDVTPESFLGFYRIGNETDHQAFLADSKSKILFPHYGFSFYDDPPGRVLKMGKGNTPSIFQSDRLVNLGLGSLVKQVKSTDMFTDEALAHYRQLSFCMVMGQVSQLKTDLGLLGHELFEKASFLNDVVRFPWISTSGVDDMEALRSQTAMYDEAFHMETSDAANYADFVYLTGHSPTSMVLSHKTVQNIIHARAKHLSPLCQIPLCIEEDKTVLCNIFSMDKHPDHHADFSRESYPLFGIFPGLFTFEGTVFDVATGLVSGKRKNVVQFLLLLNGLKLLAQRDLRYLV